MAGRLIDSMQVSFDPQDYEDTYRASVLELIKRKAAGKEIDLVQQEEPEHGDDLMAALEASTRRRKRRAAQRGADVPRALWSGSLSFGLVNVPVQLFSAARDLDYHFHQLHAKDKAPIEQRRYCSEEDVEVMWEEIARSFELDSGKEVVVTDEELASVEPHKTRTIEIEAFVDLAEVDPIYFDHPYFLVPAGESEGTLRAYRLLVEAMERQRARALGPVRDEDQGVPRRGPGARQRPGPDDDALPRRGQADRGHPDRRQEAHEASGRRCRLDHRGAVRPIGSPRATPTATASGCDG